MNGKTLGILAVGLLVVVGLFLFLNRNQQAPQQTNTTPTETLEEQSVEITTGVEKAEEATVTYTANGFTPQTLTIKVGTKVTWVNNSGSSMQVSSAPHPQHTDYPEMNQRAVDDGESVTFTFDKAGTFKYHDHLNAKNFGSVVVE